MSAEMDRTRRWILAGLVTVLLPFPAHDAMADKPCDDYPAELHDRCTRLWKEINEAAAGEVAAFGLRQLKRRQEGRITAEQHLQENMAFIRASGQRRLKLLSERMRDQEPP